MAGIFCPTCRRSFKSLNQLRVHGKWDHEGVSPHCRLCNTRLEHNVALYWHISSASKVHQEQHAQKCKIPGCRPERCIGIALNPQGTLASAGPSLPSTPSKLSTIGIIASQSSLAAPVAPSQALQPSNRPKKKQRTKPCHLCNKELKGKNGREMHMRTSVNHRKKHVQLCKVQNCDPAKCFGSPQASATIPYTTLVNPVPQNSPRTIIEPGPPDPPPSSSTGPAQPGPPDPLPSRSTGSAQPEPERVSTSMFESEITVAKPTPQARKKAKKRKAKTSNDSSRYLCLYPSRAQNTCPANLWSFRPQYTCSADYAWRSDPSSVWDEHSAFWRGMLECNHCHIPVPSGEKWDHSCSGTGSQ